MTTQKIFEIENRRLAINLIPDYNLEIYCYSSENPEIFNQPINQLTDEKDS
jgi:hypothetical protein